MTDFEEKVFRIVKKVPKGKVLSYKEVARRINRPKAYRAVGNALHKAPRDVPCHRIVSFGMRLPYNFGKCGILNQKRLLEKEGLKVDKIFKVV